MRVRRGGPGSPVGLVGNGEVGAESRFAFCESVCLTGREGVVGGVMNTPIPTEVRIGHVHLKVADLERSLGFWQGVIGLEVTQRMGNQAAFLSAGGYHHHIALNTWKSGGGKPPSARSTGLYHVALLYPTRAALAGALWRLIEAGIALEVPDAFCQPVAAFMTPFTYAGKPGCWATVASSGG